MTYSGGQSGVRNGKFLRALGWTSVGYIALPLVAFASGPLLARGLGTSERGQLATLIALIVFAPAVTSLALQESSVYVYGKYPRLAERLLQGASRGWVVGLAALGGAATTTVFYALLPHYGLLFCTAMGFYTSAMITFMPQRAYLVHRGLFRPIALERWLQAISRLAVIAVLFAMNALTVEAAMYAQTVTTVLGSVCLVVATRRALRGVSSGAIVPHRKIPAFGGLLVRVGVPIWVGSLGLIVMMRLDQVMFPQYATSSVIGLYAVAVSCAEVLLTLSAAFRLTLLPAVINNEVSIGKLFAFLSILWILALVFFFLAPFFLPRLVEAVFGAAFSDAWKSIRILMFGVVAAVWLDSCAAVLIGRNRRRHYVFACIIGALATVVLIPIFLPGGAEGAAVITGLSFGAAATSATISLCLRESPVRSGAANTH